MFNLNNAVADWRAELLRDEAFTRDDIDELEAHLYDLIESLSGNDLSDEEAFWIATHRIGAGDQLRREYAKVNRGTILTHRILWMLGGFMAVIAIDSAISIFSNALLIAGAFAGLQREQAPLIALVLKITPILLCAYFLFVRRGGMQQKLHALLAKSMEAIKSHYIVAAFLWLLLYVAGNSATGLVMTYDNYAWMSALSSTEMLFEMLMVVAIPCVLVALYAFRKPEFS